VPMVCLLLSHAILSFLVCSPASPAPLIPSLATSIQSAVERHLDSVESVKVAQKRKGCFPECLGCEAKTEFDFYKGTETDKFAHAKEESSFCCRLCLAPNHSFKMTVAEEGTSEEILSVDRPFVCCGGLSCCCFRSMDMTSGGKKIGNVRHYFV